MGDDYVPPEFERDAFNCPHCDAYAHQNWQRVTWATHPGYKNPYEGRISKCSRCQEYALWVEELIVYPPNTPAPLPNDDMPEEVKKEYEEARRVVAHSPKAAAAILRLAMEKLTQDLTGKEDEDLYSLIGELLEEGRIDGRIQKALDSVRVTGNDYVHAGEIYDDDDVETALRLFDLVNVIVEMTLTRERLIEETYSEIPENKKQGIRNRDGE